MGATVTLAGVIVTVAMLILQQSNSLREDIRGLDARLRIVEQVQAQHGIKLDQYGIKLEQYGITLEQQGIKLDQQGRKLDQQGRKLDQQGELLRRLAHEELAELPVEPSVAAQSVNL